MDYVSTNASHTKLIERDFKLSRQRSVRRRNAAIIQRHVRRQIVKDGSFVGLAVVGVLLVLEFLRAVYG